MEKENLEEQRVEKTALATHPVLLSGYSSLRDRVGIGRTRSLNTVTWLYLAWQNTENSPPISFQKPRPKAVNHPLLQLVQWITTCFRTLKWKTCKPKLMSLYLVFNFSYRRIVSRWSWFGDRILNREWKLFLIKNIVYYSYKV